MSVHPKGFGGPGEHAPALHKDREEELPPRPPPSKDREGVERPSPAPPPITLPEENNTQVGTSRNAKVQVDDQIDTDGDGLPEPRPAPISSSDEEDDPTDEDPSAGGNGPSPSTRTTPSTPSGSHALPDQVALATTSGVRSAVAAPPTANATFTLQVIGTINSEVSSGLRGSSSTSIPQRSTGVASAQATNRDASSDGTSSSSMGSTQASVTALTTLLTTSTAAFSATKTPNVNAAMNNSAPSDSSNIFRTDNRLFPLAVVIIVLGVLFFLAAIIIFWLRLSGCTKKRKLRRNAIPSFIGDHEKGMWDPKVEQLPFDLHPTQSGGVASTTTSTASTRGIHTWAPPVPPRPPPLSPIAPLGWERIPPSQAAYGGAFFPIATQPAPAQNLPNPFHSFHDHLDVPVDADAQVGSPVPSFATDRQPHDEDVLPCPKMKGRAQLDAGSGNPFEDVLRAQNQGQPGYGYVTVHRSVSLSTTSSAASSLSSYTSRTPKRFSSSTESMKSNYLATIPRSLTPAVCPNGAKGEGAELERLKSVGAPLVPKRTGSRSDGESGGSGGYPHTTLAKSAAWKLDSCTSR